MNQLPQPVLVLHQEIADGTRLDELDTLVQTQQVSSALVVLGCKVTTLSTGLDLAATLGSIRSINPACVFNLVESLGGEGRLIHFIPALLQAYGIPFTGCSGDAIYLSSHKLLAKALMQQHGIATPAWFSSSASGKPGDGSGIKGPWIVKSVWEHASFGLDDGCVVGTVAAALARIQASTRLHGGEWFAEQYIPGREFNISVLERDGSPVILPMAEMTFVDYPPDKPRIVGYAAKWDSDAAEFHATRREFPELPDELPRELHDALQQAVRQCWEGFGLRGYARVDFRVDEAGKPWVLEVNANPCIAADAGFIAAAQRAGIAPEQVVEHIVRAALTGASEGQN